MEAIRASIPGPFDQALGKVKQVFQELGFGTLTEVDVKKTLHEKIGQEMEPYTILGVCNPQLASRAIAAEHEVGVLLPCTVLVHECGGRINIAAQEPLEMIALTGNDDLAPVAREAHDRISEAIRLIAS